MLFLIGQLHALSLLQKTVQIRDQFFLFMDPGRKMLRSIDEYISNPRYKLVCTLCAFPIGKLC